MLQTIRLLKNTALKLQFPIFDAEWAEYITLATGLDSEKSQDGSSFSDCTNEATEIGSTGVYTLDMTAAEMNYDTVFVKITTTTDGAKVPCFLIKTYSDGLDTANSELAATPASTAGLRAMIQFIFEKMRHKSTMNKDTGVETLMKDDGSTPLGTATHTDDGTTVTKAEMT